MGRRAAVLNVLLLQAVLSALLLAVSCRTLPERHYNEDKLYADIIGFSDWIRPIVIPSNPETESIFFQGPKNTIFTRSKTPDNASDPFHLTVNVPEGNELTQAELIQRIPHLPVGRNTALYYALDRALDRIKLVYGNKPANAFSKDKGTYYYTRYYVILFTDGLDNVSVQLARNNKKSSYANGEQYAVELQKRMNSLFKPNILEFIASIFSPQRQNTFELFLLGLEGRDQFSSEKLADSLRPLMASYKGVAYEPIVSDDIDVLYEEFQSAFKASSFSFDIPKGYAESRRRIRMEFKVKNEEDFPYWFEADIKKKFFCNSYYLDNITKSIGFTFKGEKQKGKTTIIEPDSGGANGALSIWFTINDLRYFDAPLQISHERQQFMVEGLWRNNSEYLNLTSRNKNAYVMILLDRSDSLSRDDKKRSEDMAKNIINLLSGM